MADVMKTASDRVLVGDWTGRNMLAGSSGRAIGPYSWDLLRRAGLRTSFSGMLGSVPMLVSGIERFFSRFGFLRSIDWAFAGDAPDPVTLMLENEAAEPDFEGVVHRVRRGVASVARNGMVRPRARVAPTAASPNARDGGSERAVVSLVRTMEAVTARLVEAARAEVERRVSGILPALRLRSGPDRSVAKQAGATGPSLAGRAEGSRRAMMPGPARVATAATAGRVSPSMDDSGRPSAHPTAAVGARPAAGDFPGPTLVARPAGVSRGGGFPFTYDVATLADAVSRAADLPETLLVSARTAGPGIRGADAVVSRGTSQRPAGAATALAGVESRAPESRTSREYTTLETPEGVFVELAASETAVIAAATAALEAAGIRHRPGRTFGRTPLSGGLKDTRASRGTESRTLRFGDVPAGTPETVVAGRPVEASKVQAPGIARTGSATDPTRRPGKTGTAPAMAPERSVEPARAGRREVSATATPDAVFSEGTTRESGIRAAVRTARTARAKGPDASFTAGMDPRMPAAGTNAPAHGMAPGAVAERTSGFARSVDWSVTATPAPESRGGRREAAIAGAGIGSRATAESARAGDLSLPMTESGELIAIDTSPKGVEAASPSLRGRGARSGRILGSSPSVETASGGSVPAISGRETRQSGLRAAAGGIAPAGTREAGGFEAERTRSAATSPSLEAGFRTLRARADAGQTAPGARTGLADSFIAPLGRSVLPVSSERIASIPSARETLAAAPGYAPVAGVIRGFAERDMLVSQGWASPSRSVDTGAAETPASVWNESAGVEQASYVELASPVAALPETEGGVVPPASRKRGRGTAAVSAAKPAPGATARTASPAPANVAGPGAVVPSVPRAAGGERSREPVVSVSGRTRRAAASGDRATARASAVSAPGIAVPTILPVHAALAAAKARDGLFAADTILVSSRTTRGPRAAESQGMDMTDAADQTLIAVRGPAEAEGIADAASTRSAARRPGRLDPAVAARSGQAADRRGNWIVPAVSQPEVGTSADGMTVTGAFPVSAGAGSNFLVQSPDAIPDGVVAPMGYSLATVAAPEVFSGLRTWGSVREDGAHTVSLALAGMETGDLVSLVTPGPETPVEGTPAVRTSRAIRGRKTASLNAGRPAGINPSMAGSVSLRGMRGAAPTGGEVRVSVSRQGSMPKATRTAEARVSGATGGKPEVSGVRTDPRPGPDGYGVTLVTPVLGREAVESSAAQAEIGTRTAGTSRQVADSRPSVYESLDLLTPISQRAEKPVADAVPENRFLGGKVPGLSLDAAETLLLVQRTLARALGALPTEGAAGEALAGATDTVSYLRGMGRRAQESTRESPSPVREAAGASMEAVELEHVAVRGAEARSGIPEAARPVRATSTPVLTPGIPGGPAASKPETPELDFITPSWDSGSAGQAGSIVAHGLPATSLSVLASGIGDIGAGPGYKGAMPLVTPALSAVASGAMMADKESKPAANRSEVKTDGKGSKTKAESKLDLDALALEMADRIMKRIKRDKERRGFHG